MPSGDAQRTWFPEMVSRLGREWVASMSCEELIALRDRLDHDLQTIRTDREILPPITKCPKCGKREREAPPKVSVRAMILALGRFRIAPMEAVRAAERSWKRYRAEHDLDLYGKHVADGQSGLETSYLLKSPRNATRLLESTEELEEGKGKERKLRE